MCFALISNVLFSQILSGSPSMCYLVNTLSTNRHKQKGITVCKTFFLLFCPTIWLLYKATPFWESTPQSPTYLKNWKFRNWKVRSEFERGTLSVSHLVLSALLPPTLGCQLHCLFIIDTTDTLISFLSISLSGLLNLFVGSAYLDNCTSCSLAWSLWPPLPMHGLGTGSLSLTIKRCKRTFCLA